MILPYSATIYITDHCQYACKHCFLTSEGNLNKHNLDITFIRNVIDNIAESKIFMIVVAGGDASLHPDFIGILKYIRSKRLLPLVALNPEVYGEDIAIGLTSLGISEVQMGVNEEIYSSGIMRKHALEKLSDAIKSLARFDIKVTVALTLANTSEVGLAELLRDVLSVGASRVKIDFWEQTSFGKKANLTQCPSTTRERIKSVVEQFSEHVVLIDDNATSLGSLRAEPRIVVRSDKTLRFSETSPPIAKLSQCSKPVDIFVDTILKINESLMRKAFKNAAPHDKDIKVYFEERDKIRGSGSVFADGDRIAIFVANDLEPHLGWFVALHELGHVHLGLLGRSTPGVRHDEIQVNKWALEKMRGFVYDDYLDSLISIASSDNEDRLFFELKNSMGWNVSWKESVGDV